MLRDANTRALDYKKEVQAIKNSNLDIEHFEENLEEFKAAFGRNYELAKKKFDSAIEEIDKTIDHLKKVKDALQSSSNNLRLANDKANDLSIKKLTKDAPSLQQKFEDLKQGE